MIESLFGGSTQIINILGGIGFFAVVVITAWVIWVYMKQIKEHKGGGELDEGEWDGIREYKNPLPLGWAVTFAGLMIWAIWYWFIGYPLNAYSQIGEWNQETNEHLSKFESKWHNADKATLIAMGESVYLAQCSQCHGNTADGLGGRAADLTAYGKAAHIELVIKEGSKGMGYPGGEMPAGRMTNAAEIRTVAQYVANGMQGEGKELFNANCASCHGEDGLGMFGNFPNLVKDQGGYGSVAYGVHTVKAGKKGHIGHMPAFEKAGVLTDVQYEAVLNYILSL